MEFLEIVYFQNSVRAWLTAVGVFMGTFVAVRVIKTLLVRRISAVAHSTETKLDNLLVEVLKCTRYFFILAVSLYAGLSSLVTPERLHAFFQRAVVLVVLVQMAIWGTTVITFWIENYMKKKAAEDVASATTLGLISFMAKLVLYIVIVLTALNNLGVDITALVAGLGVGGIAVALAVQNILGDLFASLTIVLDKPFVVGDFIVVDNFSGNIEHIGLKTTRIRSLSGEQLVFANSGLLQSRIRNYKRMQRRRVLFTVGVVYQTSPEKLQMATQIIRDVIEKVSLATFDRSHFLNFGPSSLDIETVYWVENADFSVYTDVHQSILLEVHRRFAVEGLDFAYPTQTLFVQKTGAVS